jgi:hypothetical protein
MNPPSALWIKSLILALFLGYFLLGNRSGNNYICNYFVDYICTWWGRFLLYDHFHLEIYNYNSKLFLSFYSWIHLPCYCFYCNKRLCQLFYFIL